jgi:hypothetical protein
MALGGGGGGLDPRGGGGGLDPRRAPGTFLWLDADQITGLADGGTVISWPNRFGVAAAAANDGNPSRRPTYLADAGLGKPGVWFNNAHSLGGVHNQAQPEHDERVFDVRGGPC